MSENYNTRTASLKATIADIRNLEAKQIDAKKLTLNGEDILERISDAEFHSYDTRDPQLKNDELDVWNTEISLSDNGCVEVKPHVHRVDVIYNGQYEYIFEGITESQANTIKTAVKVIDNEILGADDAHIMYWLSDGLTSGYLMFYNTPLTSFNGDLSSLTNGLNMFAECSSLTSFSGDLSSLTNGLNMFSSCTSLTSFNNDLSSLTIGLSMFLGTSLTSFNNDLSSLTNGLNMFYGTSLKSFSSDLSSLTNGDNMFTRCMLDAQSVANIIHTLPTHESNGTIKIGLMCYNTEADQLLFAQECDCETWQELLDDFSAKNWTVTFQFAAKPNILYGMRSGETLPVYTKLEEVTNEKHAQYTSTDGSKFYNINYFHSTNGSTEGYDVFSSLEEASAAYNVTLKN